MAEDIPLKKRNVRPGEGQSHSFQKDEGIPFGRRIQTRIFRLQLRKES